MELGQRLRDVWQTIRAGRQGMDEGLNALIATPFDAALSIAGTLTGKKGTDAPEKNILSGQWVEAQMNRRSREAKGYDLTKETPEMKSTREGTAVVTETAATVGTILVSIWPKLARGLSATALLGARTVTTGTIASTAVTVADGALTGVDQGLDNLKKQELALNR